MNECLLWTNQSWAINWLAPKVEPAFCWLCVLRSLSKGSGSQTIERSTSRSASQSSSPLICQETPINSKISVIVAMLTLASSMSGFGCLMCPLDVLCPSVRTYIQARPVCSHVQSRDYGHLFSERLGKFVTYRFLQVKGMLYVTVLKSYIRFYICRDC